MNNSNLWQGQFLSDEEFKLQFYKVSNSPHFWAKPPISHYALFSALTHVRDSLLLQGDFYHELRADLEMREDVTTDDVEASMNGLIDFIHIDYLREKLKRELGSEYPFELKRQDPRSDYFESWYPLGILVHVTPNNSPLLGVLGVLEGLLSGNVNFLKLARKDGRFASIFYQKLIQVDTTNTLKDYVYIAKVSSREKNYLKDILAMADVVSAWGAEESILSIKEMASSKARIVEWGHKISFSYISEGKKHEKKNFDQLAYEICLNEQMACSSPQCVFVENADFNELKKIAEYLSDSLSKISPSMKRIMPGVQESAELMVTKEQVRLKSHLMNYSLIESPLHDWRIYLEDVPTLAASPLFRTVWLKPMPRNKLIDHLRPLKSYLQTAGIIATALEVESLCCDLFMAGVQRIRSIGEMTESYNGEPHDGVYALERYCQRINFKDSKTKALMIEKASFEDLKQVSPKKHVPIMEKSDFQEQVVKSEYSDLFFYSGGSSGEPKLSIFTYEDYHRQMELAAEGLYAAGLDPKADRCMNLFYAGSLYGGFTSFFTILEKLRAVHFPMGASTDFLMVGKTIIKNKVDTLLGMPSYLIQLFRENHDTFKKYKGIKKVFYGGEHFSEAQRNYLKREYGVQIIRSASYGSVDAGPLGYQCSKATGGIHHLHDKLHDLEVVALEEDVPVKKGEAGRLLFTSKVRHGQKIERYAIGDVGKIIEGPCDCGRKGIRFELLGRHGDVFRIGTTFLSYQKFQKVLLDKIEFEGALQLHLYPGSGSEKEKILIQIEDLLKKTSTNDELRNLILDHYADLNMVVNDDLVLNFQVEIVQREKLIFSPSTGKLRTVIDHRN